MTISSVPFHKLKPVDEINSRASSRDGIDELAASIAAKGLIQAIAVRPNDRDSYDVIDGRRRYMAIARLVKAGKWDKNTDLVPVVVRHDDDYQALETSLIANTVRLPMHPADQHAVFQRLIDQGRTIEQIAASFAVSERTVRQHLALAKLAPEVRKAWKTGKIDARAAQAFTLCPDHGEQAKALGTLSKAHGGCTEDRVRHQFAAERPAVTQVKPDILACYRAAGGTIADDLFSEHAYVEDAALLKRARADARCDRYTKARLSVAGQGWAWIADADELPVGWRGWKAVLPDWEPSEDVGLRADEIERRALLQQAQIDAHRPEDRARSGVVLHSWGDNPVEFEFGVLRPSADVTIEEAIDDGDDELEDGVDLPTVSEMVEDANQNVPQPYDIPSTLLATITAAQSRAAAATIATDTDLALRIAVAALRSNNDSPAKLTLGETAIGKRDVETGSFTQRLDEISDWNMGGLMAEFARLIGLSVDLVRLPYHGKTRRIAIDALLLALPGDTYLVEIRRSFAAADYFKRSNKTTAIAALGEMRAAGCVDGLAPAAAIEAMKKGEVADIATREAVKCGWLPPELRHPAYSLIAAETAVKAKRKRAAA